MPVVFYDGDVPMSLPEFGGMDTGFNYYHGADPGEYDLVVSNSEGGLDRLRELGARRAEAVFWGADPELFQPLPVDKQMDVFFYGYGDKFRRDWMEAMVGEPSRRLQHVDFALGGRDFRGDTGAAREIGDVPFNVFGRAISEARVNLNITRRAHASVSGLVDGAPVRAGDGRSGDRVEPVRRDRALVRAGARAARRRPAPTRRSRPTASCSTTPAQAEELGRARPRARARRAHLRPPRAAAARADRPPRPAAVPRWLSVAAGGARPASTRPAGAPPRRDRPGATTRRARSAASSTRSARSIRSIEIVVVDDGSRDRTAEVAAAKGARVLRLPFNLGIGGAVQTGYRYAYEHGFDLALRVDGDGQHDPAQFARPRDACPLRRRRHRRRLALHRPAGATARRGRAASAIRILAWTVTVLVGGRVTDPTSGFQVTNRRAIAPLRGRLPARLSGGRGDGAGREAPACAAPRCRSRCASARPAARRSAPSARCTTW